MWPYSNNTLFTGLNSAHGPWFADPYFKISIANSIASSEAGWVGSVINQGTHIPFQSWALLVPAGSGHAECESGETKSLFVKNSWTSGSLYDSVQFLFLFIWECECAREREWQRERENLKWTPNRVGSPTWALISQPWDQDLSWNQELDA